MQVSFNYYFIWDFSVHFSTFLTVSSTYYSIEVPELKYCKPATYSFDNLKKCLIMDSLSDIGQGLYLINNFFYIALNKFKEAE